VAHGGALTPNLDKGYILGHRFVSDYGRWRRSNDHNIQPPLGIYVAERPHAFDGMR
jgi:hypothetical protein